MIDAWVDLHDGEGYDFGVNFADWVAALILDDSPQGAKVRAALVQAMSENAMVYAGKIKPKWAGPLTDHEKKLLRFPAADLDELLGDANDGK